MCINLGNPKQALTYFNKILQEQTNNTVALLKKGNILGKIGKYEQAVQIYDTILDKNPHNLLALVNKGLALHFLRKYDEAIRCYDKALQQKPTSMTILYNKASSLICKNDITHGLEILKKVISKDESFMEMAKHDIDFQKIKHQTSFKKIVAS